MDAGHPALFVHIPEHAGHDPVLPLDISGMVEMIRDRMVKKANAT